jgi:hypothetical protein
MANPNYEAKNTTANSDEKYEALQRNETAKAKIRVAISGNGNRQEELLEGRSKKQKLKKDVKLL